METRPLSATDILNPHTKPGDYGEKASTVAALRGALVGMVATTTALTALFGLKEATTPHAVDTARIAIENGVEPSDRICDAAGELAKKHRLPFNKQACLDEMDSLTVPNEATTVDVTLTRTAVGGDGHGGLALDMHDVMVSPSE